MIISYASIVDLRFDDTTKDHTSNTTGMIHDTSGSICNLLCSLASYRLDTIVDSIDITQTCYEQTDTNSERGEYNSHRICCSLFIQLISR